MATVTSLRARHDDIVAQFHANEPFVLEVQSHALEELLPVLQEELELTEVGLSRARAFLQDPGELERPCCAAATADETRDAVTVFRFCRRARFSLPASLALIHATLSFRLVSSLSNLTPATLAPLYLTQPVFFFHPSLSDRFGRPCAVLNLKYVTRTEDGELEGLKEFVRMGWEVGRRWMADSSKAKSKDGVSPEVKVQMVVIVDLEGAGMTNLVRSTLSYAPMITDGRTIFAGGRAAAILHGFAQIAFPRNGRSESVCLLLDSRLSLTLLVQSLFSTTAGCTLECGSSRNGFSRTLRSSEFCFRRNLSCCSSSTWITY